MTSAVEKKNTATHTGYSRANESLELGPLILVVGEVFHWRKSGRRLPIDSHILFADFHEITSEMIEELKPEIVLSSLLCPSFDCIDLAQLLHRVEFTGRYRIMAPDLPNPDSILKEINGLCSEIDVGFIFENEKPWLRTN